MRRFELPLLLISLVAVLLSARFAAFRIGHLGRSSKVVAPFETSIITIGGHCFAMQKKQSLGMRGFVLGISPETRVFQFNESSMRWSQVSAPIAGMDWLHPGMSPIVVNDRMTVLTDSSRIERANQICSLDPGRGTASVLYRCPLKSQSIKSLVPLQCGGVAFLQTNPPEMTGRWLTVVTAAGNLINYPQELTTGVELVPIEGTDNFWVLASKELALFRFDGQRIEELNQWFCRDPRRTIVVGSAGRRLLVQRDKKFELRDWQGELINESVDRGPEDPWFWMHARPSLIYRDWSRFNCVRALPRDAIKWFNKIFTLDGKYAYSIRNDEAVLDFAGKHMLTFTRPRILPATAPLFGTKPTAGGASTDLSQKVLLRDRHSGDALAEHRISSLEGQVNGRNLWLSKDGEKLLHADNYLNLSVYDAFTGKKLQGIRQASRAFAWILLGIPVWSFWWFDFSRRRQVPIWCDQLILLSLIAVVLHWRFAAVGFVGNLWRIEWLCVIATLGSLCLIVTLHACRASCRPVVRSLPAVGLLAASVAVAFWLWSPTKPLIGGNEPVQWAFQQTLLRFSMATLLIVTGVLVLVGRVGIGGSQKTAWNVSMLDMFLSTGIIAAIYAFLIQLKESHWHQAVRSASLLDCLIWSLLVSAAILLAWIGLMATKLSLRARALLGVGLVVILWSGHYLWERYLFLPDETKIWNASQYAEDSFKVIAAFAFVTLWFLSPEKLRKTEAIRKTPATCARPRSKS